MSSNGTIYPSREPIINFSDVLYVYKFRDGEICRHTMSDHTLVYVYSGRMTIVSDGKTVHLHAGDCAFLSRNYRLAISAHPSEGVEFKGVFLLFTRKFLLRFHHQMDKSLLPPDGSKRMPNVVKLQEDLHISSLFQALSTFFIAWEKPTAQYMELKQIEGVESLIEIDRRFCINLFDFVGPWKIDIADFMNLNYMENLTLSEMALFTGRSVATFKRDFKRISTLSPQRWVIRKRLEEAHRLISDERKTPNSIYLQLGFKSLSHFSTAFKRQYGKTPSELLDKVI